MAVLNGARTWRRRRATGAAGRPDHWPAVDADAIAVRTVLADLPQAEREALVLRFYVDLKVDDIAVELGIPPGTVKSHIHRGPGFAAPLVVGGGFDRHRVGWPRSGGGRAAQRREPVDRHDPRAHNDGGADHLGARSGRKAAFR